MTDIIDAYFSNLIGRLESLKQTLAEPMAQLPAELGGRSLYLAGCTAPICDERRPCKIPSPDPARTRRAPEADGSGPKISAG